MLKDLKVELMYNDIGNFREMMKNIKNGNAKNKKTVSEVKNQIGLTVSWMIQRIKLRKEINSNRKHPNRKLKEKKNIWVYGTMSIGLTLASAGVKKE